MARADHFAHARRRIVDDPPTHRKDMAVKMSGTEVRSTFADTVNKVAYTDEVIEVTRHGNTIAYFVSAERYRRMSRAVMRDDDE